MGIVEQGFDRLVALIPDLSPKGREAARRMYFAGAAHLFYTLNDRVSSDGEPTADEIKLVESVDAELSGFRHDLETLIKRFAENGGTA